MLRSLVKRVYLCVLRKRLASFGKESYLSPYGHYVSARSMHVGDNVYIGPRATISASEGIWIRNGVTIGPEFTVMGGDHNFRKVGARIWESKSGGTNRPVIIEEDVWIGARVLVLEGVTIGEGAVVGAGSVVTRDLAPYTVSAGNPARRIGVRFTPEELKEHLALVGSKSLFADLVQVFE